MAKTLEIIQKEYNELSVNRDKIAIEMYRLEGQAKLLFEQKQEAERAVEDVLKDDIAGDK